MTAQLERTTVGSVSSRKFIGEVSRKVGLPFSVVEGLLENGWTLEMETNKPAKWVQAWGAKKMEEF